MVNDNTYYVGTELKFAFTVECTGFNMDEDSWQVTVTGGEGSVVCKHDDTENVNITRDDLGQWYLLVDSKQLGKGICYAIVEVDVPDEDFEDGKRHEVYKQRLVNIKNV